MTSFSPSLSAKINALLEKRNPVQLGSLHFASPLLLAPMSSICKAPFRLLMEDLGAGGTVSELISCTGIFYKNQQTLNMLHIAAQEKNIGLQLFGDNAEHMAMAAQIAEEKGAKFVDINMGCPVKKVVTKGAGSALLREPAQLGPYLKTIKKALKIPLTIKIRTGWCQQNADETIKVAREEGVEMVAIHGRTREQQYRGQADWDYIERLALVSPLPLVGNGDLHTPLAVQNRLKQTQCPGLMIGRGCLRNPFIFLEGLVEANSGEELFNGSDYLEVFHRFCHYLMEHVAAEEVMNERKQLVQMRKMLQWFSAGFPHAVKFRNALFTAETTAEVQSLATDYFLSLEGQSKTIDVQEAFMDGGHG